MKITKPSQLREGMKVKFKNRGIEYCGCAHEGNQGEWRIVGGTGTGLMLVEDDEFHYCVTGVESVEGIRAAKEGDVLVNGECGIKVLLANDFGAITSYEDDFTTASTYDTWEELEQHGYKLKGEPSPEADPIEVNGKKYDRDQLLERIKELEPID